MRAILLFFFGYLLIAKAGNGQTVTPPPSYTEYLERADSLVERREYLDAVKKIELAFQTFEGRATPDDRYKAARVYALAGKVDSAFRNIERLAAQQYVNYLK